MSTVVVVAGGSSGLGRAIVEALKDHGGYEVVIFSRKDNPQVEKETGTRVLAADYSSVEALKGLLETNKVEVLISTANSLVDPTPELNLIEAATKSNATKRFIPNAWSAFEFKDEPKFRNHPLGSVRLNVLDQLKKTDLEWTAIYPGLFMDITVLGLSSHIQAMPVFIDVEQNVAALPNKGEGKVTLTYSRDIGKYVAKLLALQTWQRSYFIAGDVKSWNEIVAAAETGKGVKFDVTYDSIEKMEKGEITELPGHAKAYEVFGGREIAMPLVQRIFATYGLWMEEGGTFTFEGQTLLNDLFPEVKPLKVEKAWKVVGGKA